MIKNKLILASVGIAAMLLPSANAAVLNLGSSGSGFINGAFFDVNRDRPTGTGVYNPFLTIQANGTEVPFALGTMKQAFTDMGTCMETKKAP